MGHEIYDVVELDRPLKIRYWWDRYTQNWIILVLDFNGYEIHSEYVGNRVSLEWMLNSLSQEYNILDIAKY